MSIRKTDKGWLVDVRPTGRHGKRIRKTLQTKAEAMRFEAHVIQKATQDKDWNAKRDDRRLTDLVQLWWEHHGQTLRDQKRRKRVLIAISEALGNPVAEKLSPDQFTKYRSKRLEANIHPRTLNNQLAYMNAMFNELHRAEIIRFSNPLAKLRMIKTVQSELTYLEDKEIRELLSSIEHPDALLITKICLATGARWGEAEALHSNQIKNGKITYTNTKSGRNRAIPISERLEQEIKARGAGKLFGGSIGAFRRALEKTSIELPAGQATHVLRHTYASHFMINGGNILTLQRALGHSSITMTMRYAHLAPDHLAESLDLNPLDRLAEST